MAKVTPRDVSPIFAIIREFLLGRSYTNALRFQELLATRSPSLPELPDGPSHRLHTNYYFSRDARREVAPPTQLTAQPLLKAGTTSGDAAGAAIKHKPTPGAVYRWD